MTVSIIIAVKTYGKNLEECVSKCRELDYPDFEIIVAPDKEIKLAYPRTKIVPTGSVSPAKKRDLSSKYAAGEILAFLDDDAYPEKDWLKNAVSNFFNPDVAAVGGPAVSPSDDDLWRKASGMVYENFLVGGPYRYRYAIGKRRDVVDYPSCNLLVRKDIFDKLGGFDTAFWPGEDTKLCLEIVSKLSKKIIYDPKVVVYHHRRPLFVPHLKQIANYAMHRGYFVKIYPQTSLKLSYFIPSLFILTIVIGAVLSLFFPFLITFLSIFLCAYLGITLIFSLSRSIKMILLVFFGIISSHFAYGLFFLKGLFANKLKEEN